MIKAPGPHQGLFARNYSLELSQDNSTVTICIFPVQTDLSQNCQRSNFTPVSFSDSSHNLAAS